MYNFIFSLDFFPKFGGAHHWLYKVGKYWPEPTIVLTSYIDKLIKEQQNFDSQPHGSIIKIKRFPFKVNSLGIDGNFFRNFLILSNFLKRFPSTSPILFHAVKATPEGVILALLKILYKRRNIKIITYAHGEEFLIAQTSRQLKLLTKWAFRASDLVIANSFSTQKLAKLFCLDSKIKVVHLGVDFEDYQIPLKERLIWRKRWGFPTKNIILITVARMEPRKNHATVIKALAKLREKGLPIVYILIGDGEERKKLETLVKDLAVEPHIKFLGCVSEREKIKSLCASDIFIMPSIQLGPMIEGFGIVFMEAAAAGLPSIAGNVGGQPEAVVHGKTGLVVDGKNADKIANAIQFLVENPDIRKRMGEEAKEWAKKHDWSIISKITYEQVKSYLG